MAETRTLELVSHEVVKTLPAKDGKPAMPVVKATFKGGDGKEIVAEGLRRKDMPPAGTQMKVELTHTEYGWKWKEPGAGWRRWPRPRLGSRGASEHRGSSGVQGRD